jgi:hypothetical protein
MYLLESKGRWSGKDLGLFIVESSLITGSFVWSTAEMDGGYQLL